MRHCIYYDNGTVYDGDPYDAVGLGVICILDYHDKAWHIHEKSDYYIWKFREDGWTGVDIFGLFDYLQSGGMKKVLFGRTIANDDFDRIKKSALKDMYDLG